MPRKIDRRGFFSLAAAGAAGSVVAVSAGGPAMAGSRLAGAVPAGQSGVSLASQGGSLRKHELRGMWIATVANIDWPSSRNLSAEAMKDELIGWLDLAVASRLNSVILQVRPTADAFWPSPLEPWSEYLTGTQGQDPGFDPLGFAVEQAHARNLELHGWFNPYRVSQQTDLEALVPEHPARQHPEWVWQYGTQLYFDPGLPAAKEHIQQAIMHAVENYDLDGVHFDDYFYPYPVAGQEIPDAGTYETYGGGFGSVEDWRRHNVDTFVASMAERIKAAKPWVKFGISPFGIWRNDSTDPLGSATAGLQSYDAQFADSRRWVLEGWLDYVNPQIYWEFGNPAADYLELAPWWSELAAESGTHLYVGEALYKATQGLFTDPEELANHVALNHEMHAAGSPVHGNVWYSANHIPQDAQGAFSRVVEQHYRHPAIVPPMNHLPRTEVRVPVLTGARPAAGGVAVRWNDTGPRRTGATSFGIYRAPGRHGILDLDDPTNLLATVRSDGGVPQSWTDTTAERGAVYSYAVTALDRVWNESAASRVRQV